MSPADSPPTAVLPPRHLRVFLASPGDVTEERRLAQEVLDRLPYDPLLHGHVTIEAVAWDKAGAGPPMLATMTPQDAIAQGLPKPSECDIVIVILWSRLGTPLPPEWTKPDGSRYRSGTEWEYEDARQSAEQHGRPKLLLYRRTEKVLLDPDVPEFDENSRQWRLVKGFFAALRNPDGSLRGGCNEYATPLQFKEDLTQHLHALIGDLVPELQVSQPGAGPVIPPCPDLPTATALYLSYLQDRHQYLSLKGMGLSERVPLQLPLLDLYVPLQARLEQPAGETWDRPLRLAGRLLEIVEQTDEEQVQASRLSEPRPVLELLQRWDSLVILGDPGAGKTTLLKYLTLKLTRGESAELGLGERLPILAPLSGYANALEKSDVRLDDFIANYFHDIGGDLPLKALLAYALEQGSALVLLDGLDEVQETRLRHLVVERVVEFYTLHRQAGNKFVITSRIIGYREVRPVATALVECTLVDFDDAEIKNFVDRWTEALEKQAQGDTPVARAAAEGERRELLDAVQRNEGVRRLAANPLLLTILALMKRQGVTLPERRVELYDQYIKTLLSTWNRARGLGRPPTRDLDLVQTIKLLAPLALWMHEVKPGVGLVKREDLRRKLEALYRQRGEADPETCAHRFLKDIRDFTGLLLERGPGEYGFIHLTFEEYLAAIAIAQQNQGDAKAIASVLGVHAAEPVWQEIGRLTVGYVGLIQQMDQIAGGVVESLITQRSEEPGAAVVLAGEAVIDAGPVGVTLASWERVIDALVETLQAVKIPKIRRRQAGLALGQLGWFPVDLDTFVEVPPGPFRYGINKEIREIYNRYWMARYPVTNKQYTQFIKSRGYQQRDYWTTAGWSWLQNEKYFQPAYWDDVELNNSLLPVVGVSWHEAIAYCRWLTVQVLVQGICTPAGRVILPTGYRIRLPTEEEWERAARGADGRNYPWGNDFKAVNANTIEDGSVLTTAVCTYPQGESPVGVWDMSGNVWEWCDRRMRCGGSWGNDRALALAASRPHFRAGDRNEDRGFRVVCATPSPNTG